MATACLSGGGLIGKTRRLLVIVAAIILVLVVVGPMRAASPPAAPQPAPSPQVRQYLDQYCVRCHNGKLKTAGLVLDTADTSAMPQHADTWEGVVRKLRAGMMPPIGSPRADQATTDAVRAQLESVLDSAAAARPNPGRTDSLHRLSRAEYKNVIQDLLALDVDVTTLLPQDDSSFGFDNIAGVLKVNQTGLERYLSAARKVSRLAIGSTSPPASTDTVAISPQQSQEEHVEGLPLGTRGGTLIHYNFPQDGEYAISIKLQCINTRGGDENCVDGSTGFPDDHQMFLLVDNEIVHTFDFPAQPRRDRYAGDAGAAVGAHTYAEAERLALRMPIKAGMHDVGVTFLRTPATTTVQRIYRQSFEKPVTYRGVDRGMQMTVPHLSKVTISGPFQSAGASDTASRRAILLCHPATTADQDPCARRILTKMARRAYRRPVADSDVAALLKFYRDGVATGKTFDAGIEEALRALLASPEFWFRIEREPVGIAPDHSYRINDFELASRLSFFLWSSIPDDELMDVATQGRLHEPAVLEKQTRRMLASPKAKRMTVNFSEQWLNLRRIAVVAPNDSDFPNFDETLRAAFIQETHLFIDSIMREQHSALELLDADFTFLNERLAKHYGIGGVHGTTFRRVSLPADSPNRGLLGQASILTVTSHATRTSPVIRGKWVLGEILGSPPAPPPPNVPELKEKQDPGTRLTMRERMAEHRSNPYCAGCHSMIDPVGFALENFDPTGRYRTADENLVPIDAAGTLPDGTKFQNLAGFRAALASHPDRFLTTLTEKLLIYALGRGLEPYDMPAVRKVVRDAAGSQYRFTSLILGIVNSVPFEMRRAGVAPGTLVASHESAR